jgi:hypothetical protein
MDVPVQKKDASSEVICVIISNRKYYYTRGVLSNLEYFREIFNKHPDKKRIKIPDREYKPFKRIMKVLVYSIKGSTLRNIGYSASIAADVKYYGIEITDILYITMKMPTNEYIYILQYRDSVGESYYDIHDNENYVNSENKPYYLRYHVMSLDRINELLKMFGKNVGKQDQQDWHKRNRYTFKFNCFGKFVLNAYFIEVIYDVCDVPIQKKESIPTHKVYIIPDVYRMKTEYDIDFPKYCKSVSIKTYDEHDEEKYVGVIAGEERKYYLRHYVLNVTSLEICSKPGAYKESHMNWHKEHDYILQLSYFNDKGREFTYIERCPLEAAGIKSVDNIN